jgi:hypothetical protein
MMQTILPSLLLSSLAAVGQQEPIQPPTFEVNTSPPDEIRSLIESLQALPTLPPPAPPPSAPDIALAVIPVRHFHILGSVAARLKLSRDFLDMRYADGSRVFFKRSGIDGFQTVGKRMIVLSPRGAHRMKLEMSEADRHKLEKYLRAPAQADVGPHGRGFPRTTSRADSRAISRS